MTALDLLSSNMSAMNKMFISLIQNISKQQKNTLSNEKMKVIYCRIDSGIYAFELVKQQEILKKRYPNHKIVADCSEQTNLDRTGFKYILGLCLSQNLEEIVIMNSDVIGTQDIYNIFKWIINFNGCNLIIHSQKEEKRNAMMILEKPQIIDSYQNFTDVYDVIETYSNLKD
ncbi:MAG TPA: hypothetical protein V6C58_10215 [Allocoleopsis sp.]